jgi:4'-phosphopantetheinyl transferase
VLDRRLPVTEIWWARRWDARPGLAALLPAGEIARIGQYRRATDRDLYLAAWALVRAVLGTALGCAPAAVPIYRRCATCGKLGHGKPRVAGRGPEFSLSHAGGGVLLAVNGETAVGADLEIATRTVDEIGQMVQGPGEAPVFGPALVRRWVRKEAVLKATGDGLAVGMRSFAVSEPDAPPRLATWPGDRGLPRRLALLDLACQPGYLAALAVMGPIGELVVRDGSALLASAG